MRPKFVRTINDAELQFTATRSTGSGGQSVNTTDSAVIMRWHIGKSAAFNEDEKALIRAAAGSRLAASDEIVLRCQELKGQKGNRDICVERLHAFVNRAIVVPEKRVPTKKSRGRRARELDSKTKDSRKKQERRRVDD